MKKSLIVFLWVLIILSAEFIGQQAVKQQQSDEVQILKQLVIGPSTQSFLRLNTEMHTACVFRLDTDTDDRYILTASNDKATKFWDARNGDLLRVFRPQIYRGDEGRLDSCALPLMADLQLQVDYTKDGIVSINELDIYMKKSVKRLNGGSKIPVTAKPLTVKDFPIAFVEKGM